MSLYTEQELHAYEQVLDFLEGAGDGLFDHDLSQQEVRDILLLNLAKVVSDSRAILALVRGRYLIQAGVLARSALDACYLMILVGFEGDKTELVEKWLSGRRVTHWVIVDQLNKYLEPEFRLPFDDYRQVRHRLDDLVHANYDALQLYPLQWPGRAQPEGEELHALVFWKSMMRFFLVTCLLVVRLVQPELDQEAREHMEQLEEQGL